MKIDEKREKKEKKKGCQHQIKGPLTSRLVQEWRGYGDDSNAIVEVEIWQSGDALYII